MPSTFFGLTIGKTGLNIAQASINTSAHNAANAQVAGYTRQIANAQACTPISLNTRAGMAGTGVELTSIERQRNIYYDAKYRQSNANYGKYDCTEYYMRSIESYFNEVGVEGNEGKGINYVMTEFFNSLETLKDNPSDSNSRIQMVEKANNMVDMVNYLSESLKNIQKEANSEIKVAVEHINSIADQISSLNRQINTLEIQGGMANDLRDKRDLLLDDLSTYGNIEVSERNIGDDTTVVNEFVVMLDGKILVDTNRCNSLKVETMAGSDAQNDVGALYLVRWNDGTLFHNKSKTLGGKLQALYQIRDGNNKENFTGVASEVKTENNELCLTVKDTNCNDINLLQIPNTQGNIIVGGIRYTYDRFDVKVESDGSFTYTFRNLKTTEANGALNLTDDASKQVSVGYAIDYKGVPYYQAQLNEFIRTVSQECNAIFNTGQDITEYNKLGMDFFNGTDSATGKNFELIENGTSVDWTDPATGIGYTVKTEITSFTSNGEANYTVHYFYKESMEITDSAGNVTQINAGDEDTALQKTGTQGETYYNMDATNFCITRAVYNNPLLVTTTSDVNAGVEGTDVLDQVIAKLKDRNLFKQGTAGQFLETFTSNIGTNASQAILFAESQKNINESIDEQRMAISSVDSDEEAINLVKYKNAYDLNAKVISTMSQLYEILLNM